MAAMLGYVEIIRSLYHIDIVRQNFRKLQHTCNAATIPPCSTCQIKDLFCRLSISMRESVINPLHLTNTISKTHLISTVANGNSGNRNGYSLLYTSIMSLLPSELDLRTVYSLTKVCLTCNSYSHFETVQKLIHAIDTVESVLPSFEFGIKANLDSNEFCDKPNCFGSLRIFRVLKGIPNVLTFEFECMTTAQLPLQLKPCLIFECAASTELTLACATLCNPPATLFFHSRLQLWIHLDACSVTPITSYAQVQAMNLSLRFAYYAKTQQIPEMEQKVEQKLSPSHTFLENTHQVQTNQKLAPYHTLDKNLRLGNTAQENLSRDHTLGRSLSTVHTSENKTTNKGHSLDRNLRVVHTSQETLRVVHTQQAQNEKCLHILDATAKFSETLSENFSSPETLSGNLNCSKTFSETLTSAPTFRQNLSCASTVDEKLRLPHTPVHFASDIDDGRIYENWPLDSDSGQGSDLTSSLSSEPLLPRSSSFLDDKQNSKYATIKRRKVKSRALPVSVSVPDLSHCMDPTKKVSFDCQVTLVDEGVDEYLPHPILQRLLQQINLS